MKKSTQSEPVMIYTIGKVGTVAIQSALDRADLKTYKIHSLRRNALEQRISRARDAGRHPKTDLNALDFLVSVEPRTESIKTICLVREAIGRNISGFFQQLWKYDLKPPFDGVDVEQLRDLFLARHNHYRLDKWFRNEFQKRFKINLFKAGFKCDDGFQVMESEKGQVLLLQSELDDERTSQVVSEFVGVNVKVKQEHTTREKPHGFLNQEFKRKVRLPEPYIDEMLRTKSMKTFYSGQQIAHIRSFYLGQVESLLPLPRETG